MVAGEEEEEEEEEDEEEEEEEDVEEEEEEDEEEEEGWGRSSCPRAGQGCSHQLTAASKIISHQGLERGCGLLQLGKGLW